MNTADRSIALMDTALRRRFQFIERMPDVTVLRKMGADKIRVEGVELDVALMLEWELEQKNITGIDVFQIKSLLILGAIRPDFLEYPNREWGYGQLNLYNTFEAMRQL